ncbi:hypothetical protein A3Q56_01324 [Intoshia linei]|uniref:Uncharacterized protein n=1 Tax=Intoshia linei TaxID=1819745 RepID=A0A177B9I2_9BILA|nr:hypothetical protein A3Q56_01324 [Intoshia linei]
MEINSIDEEDEISKDICHKFKNLRNLTDYEKSHKGFLLSRINQQSELILLLKCRCDDLSHRLTKSKSLNVSYTTSVDIIENNLKEVLTEKDHWQNRFNQLNENHVELIKIKNDYKEANKHLVLQISSVDLTNSKFNKTINILNQKLIEKDTMISWLKKEFSNTHNEYKLKMETLTLKNQHMQTEMKQLKNDLLDKEKLIRCKNLEVNNIKEKSDKNTMIACQDLNKKINIIQSENKNLQELLVKKNKIAQKNLQDAKKLNEKVDKYETKISIQNKCIEELTEKIDSNQDYINIKIKCDHLMTEKIILEKDYTTFKEYAMNLIEKERRENKNLVYFHG